MKRRTVQVNLVLVGLAALWVYLLADNRGRFDAGQRLDPSGPGSGANAASPRPVSPGSPSDAAAIADHHLFHVDRHNDLPEEDSEAPEAVSLRLPVLMGTMGFGGEDYALMVSSDPNNPDSLYRRLKAGQILDGYTLVRVETDGVVMRSRAGEVRIGINEKPRKGSVRTWQSTPKGLQPAPSVCFDLPTQPAAFLRPSHHVPEAGVQNVRGSGGNSQGWEAPGRAPDAIWPDAGLGRGQTG